MAHEVGTLSVPDNIVGITLIISMIVVLVIIYFVIKHKTKKDESNGNHK